MDLLSSGVRDELNLRILERVSELASEADDVLLQKEGFRFREFSKHVTQIKTFLEELHSRRVETKLETSRTLLQTLEREIKTASNIIKQYKTCSRFRLAISSHSLLSQLQQSANHIAQAIQLLFSLAAMDSTLKLKSKALEIIEGLESLDFGSAAATETIISEIDKSAIQNCRGRSHVMDLLQQIAETVGTSSNSSPVRSEIELLKKDIEELEARKQHAEALQLSQLLHLVHAMEMEPRPTDESQTDTSSENSISFFSCPLRGELMENPVATVCGHSFEERSIMEHLQRGGRRCPACSEELASLELTPNISLLSSIDEWKQRNTHWKLQTAISGVHSDDASMVNKALEDLQTLMETTSCIAEVSRQEVVAKLVDLLKTNTVNSKAALKCLCSLARYSEENKEHIARKGAVRCIIKQFCRGEIEPEAVEVLLELSKKESLAEHIGNTKDSIASLVSLIQNSDTNINQQAKSVLDNLSFNTHLVIKMAKAGHFEPFLSHFLQGNSQTKAAMATELTRMQLNEQTAKVFEDEQFIKLLTEMLYSNSLACKSSCIHCIKKLLAFNGLARLFLLDRNTVPAILGLMSSTSSEPQWKQEATEILVSLVRAIQPNNYEANPRLHELHSQHNIHFFLQLVSTSIPQTKTLLLSLLLALVQKSDMARDLIHSDQGALACLFSTIEGDQHSQVRLHAVKLILCIAEGHPDGIQLPLSPNKESILTALVKIFNSSPNTEERSAVAGIISRLPSNDAAIDEVLCKSETLKSIREVISVADDIHLRKVNGLPPASASHGLLENVLAVLLRYTEPTKPVLHRQVSRLELYQPLVHILSTGSSLAKQRTALALAHLSQSTRVTSNTTAITGDRRNSFFLLGWLASFLYHSSWCCPSMTEQPGLCSIHGSACSFQHVFCLIKVDAVRPLIKTLGETESGASEAALIALDTLLKDDCTITRAVAAIVECDGLSAVIKVLERGPLAAKEKALDLFEKILKHSRFTQEEFQKSTGILFHLLQFDVLKKKAALVLSEMDVIPQLSSYF